MNMAELADKIRRFGLGFIGAVCSMGILFGVSNNEPFIILASVLVFSLTMVTMQEIKNRKETTEEGQDDV